MSNDKDITTLKLCTLLKKIKHTEDIKSLFLNQHSMRVI